MRTTFVIALMVLGSQTHAYAQTASAAKPLDASSQQALQETQTLMGNPAAIQEYTKTHPEAAQANSQVQSLTGGNAEDTAAVYKIANEIFTNMAKESNGDGAGMQATLAAAMKNPQSFAEKLTPEQRTELQNLTKKIESRAPGSSPH